MSVDNNDGSKRRPLLHRRSLLVATNDTLPPPVHFESFRIPDEQLKTYTNKKVKDFYKDQNEMINRFTQVDRVVESLQNSSLYNYGSIIDEESALSATEPSLISANNESARLLTNNNISRSSSPDDTSNAKSPVWIIHLAINLSFLANVALFLTKIVIAWFSGSMALLASAYESFLDIVSNAIIFVTARLIRQKNLYNYPVGKSRMEPLGIIVFAVVITTSFSQVLMTSIEKLTTGEEIGEIVDLSTAAITILAINILVKGLLWAWCATVKGSSSVEALAYDHENDVVFTIASTLFPLIGNWMNWPWLDPVGAILLSIYIIYEWLGVLLENIRRLTGQAASADDIKQLTYMAYRFSKKITAVDTVRAYYVGDRLLVEVDIILPPDCPLREAHDVGEALQDALELMDNVERAFVHLDYSAEHEIEHRRAVDNI